MLKIKVIIVILLLVEGLFLWNSMQWENSFWTARTEADWQIFKAKVQLGNTQPLYTINEMKLESEDLTKIPDEIDFYVGLETISFYFNEIEYLPESIGYLRELKHLNLSLT